MNKAFGETSDEAFQQSRQTAFCLGYKAGVVDVGDALRQQYGGDLAQMIAAFTVVQSLVERQRALATSLVTELDGVLEEFREEIDRDPLVTIEHLSSEACRDLANAGNGMQDLGAALREALQIARARGQGNVTPDQETRLTALEQVLLGWSV